MEISKLTLSPRVSAQKSAQRQILEWIQQHPNQMRNTNCRTLAKSMRISGYKDVSIQQYIRRMIDNQMLTRFGGKRRANIRINYFHKDIPQDILDSAPKEEKDLVAKTLAGIKSNQYIDETGCVTTKSEKPRDKALITPIKVDSNTPIESQEIAVPMTITKSKDGRSINIAVNLTINL